MSCIEFFFLVTNWWQLAKQKCSDNRSLLKILNSWSQTSSLAFKFIVCYIIKPFIMSCILFAISWRMIRILFFSQQKLPYHALLDWHSTLSKLKSHTKDIHMLVYFMGMCWMEFPSTLAQGQIEGTSVNWRNSSSLGTSIHSIDNKGRNLEVLYAG